MRELERRVVLSVLDRKWREHLYEMDYLREGIYLRAYSQRDPLVEYQREGFDMFAAMMDGIKEEAVGFLFNLEVQVEEERAEDDVEDEVEADASRCVEPDGAVQPPRREQPQIRAKGLERPAAPQNLSYSAPTEDGEAEVQGRGRRSSDEYAGVGRNDQCPCGSGKKYKQCHGAPGRPDRPHRPRQRLSVASALDAAGVRRTPRRACSCQPLGSAACAARSGRRRARERSP